MKSLILILKVYMNLIIWFEMIWLILYLFSWQQQSSCVKADHVLQYDPRWSKEHLKVQRKSIWLFVQRLTWPMSLFYTQTLHCDVALILNPKLGSFIVLFDPKSQLFNADFWAHCRNHMMKPTHWCTEVNTVFIWLLFFCKYLWTM